MDKEYFTVAEAAEFSTLAVSTLRLYIRQGKLRASKIGRRVVINKQNLEGLLNAKKIEGNGVSL